MLEKPRNDLWMRVEVVEVWKECWIDRWECVSCRYAVELDSADCWVSDEEVQEELGREIWFFHDEGIIQVNKFFEDWECEV